MYFQAHPWASNFYKGNGRALPEPRVSTSLHEWSIVMADFVIWEILHLESSS